MNYAVHKQRLIDMEERLTSRVEDQTALRREHSETVAGDSGDASVASENVRQRFAQAESGSNVLAQVRAALERIAAGTFGQCMVDGEPIEPARLEASPWVPYCLKHQTQFEASGDGVPTTTM
jgi:RNA polymerase-binding transcription factor DksA